MGMGSVGSDFLCRNFQTHSRQRQGPGPIVSYGASPIPCTVRGRSPLRCE